MPQLPVVVGPEFTPHWREDLSEDEYHADATASSSGRLKRMDKSAANFMAAYLQDEQDELGKPDYFRLGSAVHMAVLESKRFFEAFVKMPEFSGTGSKAAKAEWIAGQPKGAVVLSEKEFIQVEGIVNSVLANRQASNLLKNGKPEVAGYYRDPETGIKCRIKPDFYGTYQGHTVLIDLKTTQDASAEAFSRAIWNYRYDMQMAMYSLGIQEIEGQAPYYPIFMAIEKLPPYEVAIYIADEMMLNKGYEMYRRCMDKLGECLKANKWPGLQSGLQTISLPLWALSK